MPVPSEAHCNQLQIWFKGYESNVHASGSKPDRDASNPALDLFGS